MTRQRVADRGTECRVPLRCLSPDTDDFLETRRYLRARAELRDNVEFCCDRWRVIITGKWDVVDMCVRTVCAWFWTVHLSFVALPCVHVHENRVWTIIIWLTRPLWSAACPTLTTKPGIENIESSIETWAEKWCPPEWLGGDLLQFMIGICSGHCRRRHWAASTSNCKLLVLALSSFVLGTLGGFWFPFKSWTKWF